MDINAKLNLLKTKMTAMEAILLAYSGGVDSSLLLKVAGSIPIRVLAVTASSPIRPEAEIKAAKILAAEIDVPHLVITTDELHNNNFRTNPPERCYYCKKELMARLNELAAQYNLKVIVDGTNAEDAADFRPGNKATEEYGIRSPLQEVNLTKTEIRLLAKHLGLPNWNKPAQPCLATRIPYGELITEDKVKQVEAAETYLSGLGFRELRVRHHGTIARLEVNPASFSLLIDDTIRKDLIDYFHKLGFLFIVLDLEGFRSGSLNTVLEMVKKQN